MRVKRGVRKTLCLQIKGVSKRCDFAYTGDEMTALGTVLFKFDLIMYTEIWSDSCVCTLNGVCSKTGRRLPPGAGMFSLPPSVIGRRAHPVLCPVDSGCYSAT